MSIMMYEFCYIKCTHTIRCLQLLLFRSLRPYVHHRVFTLYTYPNIYLFIYVKRRLMCQPEMKTVSVRNLFTHTLKHDYTLCLSKTHTHTHIFSVITLNCAEAISFHKPPFSEEITTSPVR